MATSSPEEMKKGMESWMAWAKKCGSGLVDMGSPMGIGLKITPAGASPSSQNVVGYSMLQAESMDQALTLLKGHPHLAWAAGCVIEVHESLPLPGSG